MSTLTPSAIIPTQRHPEMVPSMVASLLAGKVAPEPFSSAMVIMGTSGEACELLSVEALASTPQGRLARRALARLGAVPSV